MSHQPPSSFSLWISLFCNWKVLWVVKKSKKHEKPLSPVELEPEGCEKVVGLQRQKWSKCGSSEYFTKNVTTRLCWCTEPTHLSWLWNSGAAWLSGLLRIIANEAKKVNPENLSDLRVRNRATLAGYTRTKLLSPTVSPFSNTHNRRLDHFSRLNLFLKNSSFLWTTQHKGEEKRIVKNRRAHLEWSMEIIIQLSSVSRSSSLHARS